jgi:hypothetical protein
VGSPHTWAGTPASLIAVRRPAIRRAPHGVHARVDLALLELGDHGAGHAGGHRVRAERAGLHGERQHAQAPPGVGQVHDVRAPTQHAERQAAADGLARAAQVGGHAVAGLRAAEPQTEARDHLVEDQRDAEVGGDGAQPRQEERVRQERPLDGLHDHAGELVVVPLDDGRGGLEVVEGGHQHLGLHAARDAVRVGHAARVGGVAHRPLIAHQRVVVHPVVAALELQDLVTASERARQAQREERGLRPAAVQRHLLGAGHVLHDLLGQADGVLVDDQVRRAVEAHSRQRLEHGGVRVAQHVRARAQQVVDVLVAAHVGEPRAARGAHHEVELLLERERSRARGQQPLGPGDELTLSLGPLNHHSPALLFSMLRGKRAMYWAKRSWTMARGTPKSLRS